MAFWLYKLHVYMYKICRIVLAEGGPRICGFAIGEQKKNLRSHLCSFVNCIWNVQKHLQYTLNADWLFLSHLTQEFIFLYLRENIDILSGHLAAVFETIASVSVCPLFAWKIGREKNTMETKVWEKQEGDKYPPTGR